MSGQEDYPRHSYCMEKSGLENECKWSAKGGEAQWAQCPHRIEKRDHNKKILDNILDYVGNTPLVRINNITEKENIECELLAKCEFLNPGGSVKDRIGRRMVLDARASGQLKKGDILIEPTSGNTGVGLSMAAAALGYRMIITMPEKMSQEKQDALRGLGATVIRTPNPYAFDHKFCHIGIAIQLVEDLAPHAHCLDQYKNPGNPMAHYDGTGQEIWDQCDGKLDYVFLGSGTGGTACGIARRLKELNPEIKIVAIDPKGSDLALPASLNDDKPEGGYQVEGIGYDFIPRVFDRTVVDDWIKSDDKPSFLMARRLLREEGLMCGGSSGTAMYAAVEYIKKHKIGKGKRCVVLLPDNIRNYMTKHLNADWMYEKGFISEQECADMQTSDLVPNKDWGQDKTVGDFQWPEAAFLSSDMTLEEAVAMFTNEASHTVYPVKDATGKVLGVLSRVEVMRKMVKKQANAGDKIGEFVVKELRHVSNGIKLNELARVLVRNKYVLIDGSKWCTDKDLLRVVAQAELPTKPAEPVAEPKETPAKEATASEGGMSAMKMATLSVASATLGAAAAFMLAKNAK